MPSANRPPHWGRVWLEARAAGRNPVAALVAAGLVDGSEVGPSGAAPPPLPPVRPSRQARAAWRRAPPSGPAAIPRGGDEALGPELAAKPGSSVEPVRAAG